MLTKITTKLFELICTISLVCNIIAKECLRDEEEYENEEG